MTVAELAAILAHLPSEAEVVVCSHYACHVAQVERPHRPLSKAQSELNVALRGRPQTPPQVILRGGVTQWWHEPPPFEIRCRVRDQRGLDAELDALSAFAEPTGEDVTR